MGVYLEVGMVDKRLLKEVLLSFGDREKGAFSDPG